MYGAWASPAAGHTQGPELTEALEELRDDVLANYTSRLLLLVVEISLFI